MLIQVLRQTMLSGAVIRVGEVLEASPSDAKMLIGIGKAVAVTAAVASIPEPIKPTPPKRRAKQ